jgi:hypothetical protein
VRRSFYSNTTQSQPYTIPTRSEASQSGIRTSKAQPPPHPSESIVERSKYPLCALFKIKKKNENRNERGKQEKIRQHKHEISAFSNPILPNHEQQERDS